jgi:protein-tyrosine phosphatase
MVCLGNICRSPLAEGILQKKFSEKKIKGSVDSAGLINYHEGEHPDHRSISTARKHGIDISGQISRMFKPEDLNNFDFIFAMDGNNFENLLEYAQTKEHISKVHLLLGFAEMGHRRSVPDPYYGKLVDFETVFTLLDKACEIVADKIKAHTSELNNTK